MSDSHRSILRSSHLARNSSRGSRIGSNSRRASFSNDGPELVIPPGLENFAGESFGDSQGDSQASSGSNDNANPGTSTRNHIRRSRRNSLTNNYPRFRSSASLLSESSGNSLKWYSSISWCTPSEKVLNAMRRTLKSNIWKFVVYFFTFVLLFGGSIQFFFAGQSESANVYFDAIYIITMVLLLTDIVLMVFIESAYFCLKFEKHDIQIGSFKFWFDLLSVLSLIFNLSAVGMIGKSSKTMNLEEFNDDDGVYFFGTNWFHFDVLLMVTIIVRTFKVARFFQIQYVLDGAARSRLFYIHVTKKLKSLFPNRRRTTHIISLRDIFSRNLGRNPSGMSVYGGDADLSSRSASDGVRQRHYAATKIQRAYRRYRRITGGAKKNRKKKKNSEERLRRLRFNRSNLSSSRDSAIQKRMRARRDRSQIGLALNHKLTKLVAFGIIISVILSILFAIQEEDMSQTMVVLSLHNTIDALRGTSQFDNDTFEMLMETTVSSSAKNLVRFNYTYDNGNYIYNQTSLIDTDPETATIIVQNETISVAEFDMKSKCYQEGFVSIIFTLFLISIWLVGLVLFAGPVTYLVVIPIERMVRLLTMLEKDPLGYDNTNRYKQFASEEQELALHTRWTSDNLKGMETQFLMETILCTGSLMKVGFGTAGAKIIRDYLKGSKKQKDVMQKGIASTVSCIFMFCDIRQFTDATECLQEEVFLFTNKIAAVVHSICHSFGGSANKNIGDAFLMSWKLDEPTAMNELHASDKQADKALLSVVNICIALCYEEYYVEDISETARSELMKKFQNRKGNLVQVGFGLHAGRAVEGAIGSRRKLDATYLSNAVELAETLESSTKKYGVSLLMSGQFYELLDKNNQGRCRQIDEMFFISDYEADDPRDCDIEEDSEMHMRLFTYDVDLESLRKQGVHTDQFSETGLNNIDEHSYISESVSGMSGQPIANGQSLSDRPSRRLSSLRNPNSRRRGFHASVRRMSLAVLRKSHENFSEKIQFVNDEFMQPRKFDKLVLPTGLARYNFKSWQTEEIRIIRSRYKPVFFQKFNEGFQAYLTGNWVLARSTLEFVKNRFNDKPSQVLLEKMEQSNYIPPPYFRLTLGKE